MDRKVAADPRYQLPASTVEDRRGRRWSYRRGPDERPPETVIPTFRAHGFYLCSCGRGTRSDRFLRIADRIPSHFLARPARRIPGYRRFWKVSGAWGYGNCDRA